METNNFCDLRGLNCPLPALRARKRLARMRAGETLVIETTDPLATLDIPAMCQEEGHTLLLSETVSGGHRFAIRKNEELLS